MNRLLSFALLALLACPALLVAADPPAKKDSAKDSALVQASKKNGGARKKKPGKVITNADVKKSTGKLIVLPSKTVEEAEPASTAPKKGLLQEQDENRKARLEAEKRWTEAEARVHQLEQELARIEQSYYDEADPNRRDSAIRPRFVQTKSQLDDARKELADARDAYDRARGVAKP